MIYNESTWDCLAQPIQMKTLSNQRKDIAVDAPFVDEPRETSTGVGELGLALEKHLAGCPVDISEREFLLWARAGDAPDAARRFALQEALMNMDAAETRRALFDGRASMGQVARLVVRCNGDRNRFWNNLISFACPEVKIRDLGEDREWDRRMANMDGEPGLVHF